MQPVGDVLVLAGDVVTFRGLTKARGFFDFVCDHYAAVYWVPANHEYYGSDISDRPSPLCEKIRDNFYLVNNHSIVHGGVRLVFTTLWSRIGPLLEWDIQRSIKRTIPLVGFALDAFKAFPQGFNQYRDRPDQLSAALGKYLRENKLLPTENHTTYSLRHSFQDRLLAANAPDRLQADLMGHKFQRPAYGEGATLAHKLEWMQKIQLKDD